MAVIARERRQANPTVQTKRRSDEQGNSTMIVRKHVGPRMSRVVVHNGTVYLAGATAADTSVSTGEQTKQVLAKMEGFLADAGSDKSKILSATIWLKDIASFAEMNAVWDAWVPTGHTPARACVEAKLAGPQYLVEIAIVAAV
jgi:enamine deaminase RidA (YjgF/YER057c/UK114 family)